MPETPLPAYAATCCTKRGSASRRYICTGPCPGEQFRKFTHTLASFLFVFACLLQLFVAPVLAQLRNWQTFANTRNVRAITAFQEQIVAASSGGLLLFDPETATFRTLTNANGLSSNDITALAADKLGRLWVAAGDGKINIFEPKTGNFRIILLEQERSFTINDFLALGDTMYIALDFGVGEYRLDRDELKETYKQLGLAFTPGVAATRLLHHGGMLYVGTREGIAMAPLDFPNLKAPQSWVNQASGDGLPAGAITDLTVYENRVVAATRSGIAIQEGAGWRLISAALPEREIKALAVRNTPTGTELLAATQFSIYRSSDLANWQKLDGFPGPPNDVLVVNEAIWGASQNAGLASFAETTGSWTVHEPNSPKTSSFSSVAVDQNGVLWCTSAIDGFLSFDGERWQNYEQLGALARGDYRAVVVDDQGRVWLGSWGKGITVLQSTEDGPEITSIDTTGGLLAGIPNDLAFVVVNEMAQDRHGNIWISNLGAATNRKLAVVTPEGQWAYFLLPNASQIEIQRLVIDQFDQVWYGTRDDGVRVFDYRGTLFDPTDDVFTFGAAITAQLESDRITGLAEDADGTVWIGTNDGLYFWFGNQLAQQFRLISNDITVVRVDPSNNKWVGTSSGFTIISANNATLQHFTPENSPLVGAVVTDFAFNPETGQAYIATTNGLSSVLTPFTTLREDFSLLRGYPNPFVIDGSGELFTITNLVRQSEVAIYTEDGRLVRRFRTGEVAGAQALWDGRDQDGRLVPSGIYIFVAFSQAGNAGGAGKVAVVRR